MLCPPVNKGSYGVRLIGAAIVCAFGITLFFIGVGKKVIVG